MYLFIAFYKGRSIQIRAETSYEAQQNAAKVFRAKKHYDVTIMRADITHTADF